MAHGNLDSLKVIPRILSKAPAVFAMLLALTATLLIWQHYGMERVYEVSAASGHTYGGFDDSEIGGASTSSVTREGKALRLKCNLVKKFAWPYCKLSFRLGVDVQGVDLSRYDHLTLDADYASGTRRVRLSIVDFEPGFSTPDVWQTNKVNEVDPFAIPVNGMIAIPLDLLHTAAWWKDQAKPPLLRTNVRIDNVIEVTVQTAPDIPLGEQDIVLRSIRFHGKAISFPDLLLGLVAMWIVCAIGWPATMYYLLKHELTHSQAEVQLLNEVNRALRLETRELAGQAHLDPLTGVLNRQGLRAHLIDATTRIAEPMSVIFLDIDHFKQVNDQHGHQVGDAVLQKFAATIGALIRSHDKLVRWGGEEFLLLCPMTDAAQAAGLAEKLRSALQATEWPQDLAVSASFGVAEHQSGEEIGQVIERADRQLYCAKAAGRNRVHTHGLAVD